MTGWCPYKDGALKDTECHHDGYCSDCPYKFEKQVLLILEKTNGDPEAFHVETHNLMESVLKDLGYEKGIEVIEAHECY